MRRKHPKRSAARSAALELLYSAEITGRDPNEVACDEDYPADAGQIDDYARRLIAGVAEHQAELDRMLEEASENWSLIRMPIIDRAILRTATFEMLYVDEVPLSVSIDEAVELAKRFGGEDESPRFVNGVLGKIAQRIDPDVKIAEIVDDADCDGDAAGVAGDGAAGDGAAAGAGDAAADAAGDAAGEQE